MGFIFLVSPSGPTIKAVHFVEAAQSLQYLAIILGHCHERHTSRAVVGGFLLIIFFVCFIVTLFIIYG